MSKCQCCRLKLSCRLIAFTFYTDIVIEYLLDRNIGWFCSKYILREYDSIELTNHFPQTNTVDKHVLGIAIVLAHFQTPPTFPMNVLFYECPTK